jgi:pyruvate dehydrogenase (quinone)
MITKNVADVFVETLVLAGVRRIYGLVGDSLNGLTEAIRRNDAVEWIHVRHEESAAFAAGADAHLTGAIAVCAGSCGPGNLHLINGLYDCHRNRVPVLAIAAQIPRRELGSEYFQETHPEILFKDCSHFCEILCDADQFPRILGIALRTSIVKRGVSVVVMPGDVALRPCDALPLPLGILDAAPSTVPSKAELRSTADLLSLARKVTILGGAGCQYAHAELLAVAQRLKAPIVHALRGKEFIEHDNPYDVGMTGLIGFSSGYHAMMECDLLLVVGSDFPYTQFYPHEAKIVQIDLRGEQIGRRARVDLGLIGSAKETLGALVDLLPEKPDRAHLDACLEHYRMSRSELDKQATCDSTRLPIHPQSVAKILDEICEDDAIFTCDVGTPTVWAARYLRMNGQRRLVGSFIHGSMANALPQAIGAQIAFPRRQVVALSGDGGLSMLLGELLTLPQLQLPVKIVVFSNSSLAFVELEMKAAGLIDFGTDLLNPNFAKLADAAGILGLRVERPEELRPALERALRHDGPVLVDVVVNRQELPIPPKIVIDQAIGLGLYMVKAVLNGRGDEVVDLVKSNLIR